MNAHIKLISLPLALAATAITHQASATELSGSPPQVRVTYADLNLNQPAGAATLYARIAGAAARVCPEVDSRNLLGQARRKACRAEAIRRAVASVSAAELTRYYAGVTRIPDTPGRFK